MKVIHSIAFILFIQMALVLNLNGQESEMTKEFEVLNQRLITYLKAEQPDSAFIYLTKMNQLLKSPNAKKIEPYIYLRNAFYYQSIYDYPKLGYYARISFKLLEPTNDVKSKLDALFYLGSYYNFISQYDSVKQLYKNYSKLAKESNYIDRFAGLTVLYGRSLLSQGKNQEASNVLREALDQTVKSKDTLNTFQLLVQLAASYQEVNFEFAMDYLRKAKDYLQGISPKEKASFYLSVGNAFQHHHKLDSALYYYQLNLELQNDKKDLIQYGAVIGNMANVYLEMGQLEKALTYNLESLDCFLKMKDSLDIEIAYGSIGDLYLRMKEYKKAIEYFNMANGIAERLGLLEEFIYNYEGLYKCYERLGRYKEAHEAFKLHDKYTDSIRSVETTKKLTEQELNYRFNQEKKEEALMQKAKDDLIAEKIKRQRFTIYSAVGGGLLLLIFLGFALRSSIIRKKINQQLAESNQEIHLQKSVIEIKNREITDSIHYASRIQQGIIPDNDELKELLPNSFVFFKPRDIVSGDFYWIKKTESQPKQNKIGIAVADCTGHGVPGAFMSFIGSTIFNQAAINKSLQNPADTLLYLNQQLGVTLKSKSDTGKINDGMEVGYCIYDTTSKIILFAGANIDLIIIRNSEIIEIKGDKHSIGLSDEQQKEFTNHELQLINDDCIYMFSDGYPDQFGGEKGKKYKRKNLISLLRENSGLNSESQLELLNSNFNDWKNNLEQIDDVLVFGMKV